jgi:hypothetical protein
MRTPRTGVPAKERGRFGTLYFLMPTQQYFLMPTQQLLDRVRELREAGRTPKKIARALKMPPSAVASLIRSAAAAEGWIREETPIG